jgi:hypothetical protein
MHPPPTYAFTALVFRDRDIVKSSWFTDVTLYYYDASTAEAMQYRIGYGKYDHE